MSTGNIPDQNPEAARQAKEAKRLVKLESIKTKDPKHYHKLFSLPAEKPAGRNPKLPHTGDYGKAEALASTDAVLEKHYTIPPEVIEESAKLDRKIPTSGGPPPPRGPRPRGRWWEERPEGNWGLIVFGAVAAVAVGAVIYSAVHEKNKQKEATRRQMQQQKEASWTERTAKSDSSSPPQQSLG